MSKYALRACKCVGCEMCVYVPRVVPTATAIMVAMVQNHDHYGATCDMLQISCGLGPCCSAGWSDLL